MAVTNLIKYLKIFAPYQLPAIFILFLALNQPAIAGVPLSAMQLPSGAVGTYADVLVEEGSELSLNDVKSRLQRGSFSAGQRPVLSFGIGARPVWLHWRIENGSAQPALRRLTIDTPWIDRIDVFIVEGDSLVAQWHTGDAVPYRQRPVSGLGFIFDHDYRQGATDVFLRAETVDPMVLPVSFQGRDVSIWQTQSWSYSYGFIYGYLLALIAYNVMLYAGLRKRSHLIYAIYLAMFITTNLAYTGHGYAWLWSDYPGVQRYIILVFMILFGVTGLQFASRFLDLSRRAPLARRGVHSLCIAGLVAMGGAVVAGAQEAAAWIAFGFVVVFAITMLVLGAHAIRNGFQAGRYFLAAAIAAMTGTLITTLAVLGLIPYTVWTFRAVEAGMLADATLLALALAHRYRLDQMERLRAEQLARTDQLTRLPNRRAFRELAEPIWSNTLRNNRNIALIMLDIDHFKRLNDTYGHARGDEVLAMVGQVLLATARRGDVIARWGGEEFMMLMPETDKHQASVLAERLRLQISSSHFSTPAGEISVTVSFGVAQRNGDATLDELIDEADTMLYRAKQLGRNQVSCSGVTDAVVMGASL